MFPNISKTYILVSFGFLLIFSGAIYTYLNDTTIPFSFCEPCHENPEPVVNEVAKRVEMKHFPNMGVGNLEMRVGLQYPQPSTQKGLISSVTTAGILTCTL